MGSHTCNRSGRRCSTINPKMWTVTSRGQFLPNSCLPQSPTHASCLENPEYFAVKVPRPALRTRPQPAEEPGLWPLASLRPLGGAVHQPLQQPEHFTFYLRYFRKDILGVMCMLVLFPLLLCMAWWPSRIRFLSNLSPWLWNVWSFAK